MYDTIDDRYSIFALYSNVAKFVDFACFDVFSSSSSSGYRSEIQYRNVTLTTVRLGQDSHLSRVCTVIGSNIYMIKLCTPVACYAVDGAWTAIEAWRAVLKASIFRMSVIVDGSLFHSCMVLGENDIFKL